MKNSIVKQFVRQMAYGCLSFPGSFPYRSYFVKKKSIYIHIPKCGGSSILKLYSSSYRRDHATWYEFYMSNPVRWEKYFKFTVVRNPWARLLSLYRYFSMGGNLSTDLGIVSTLKENNYDFERFVIRVARDKDWQADRMFWPQVYFTHSRDGFQLDKWIQLEQIDDGLKDVAGLAGLRDRKMHHLNASGEAVDYKEFYNSSTLQIVHDIYWQDVEAFGYKYE